MRVMLLHEDKRGYGKGGGAESMLRDMSMALQSAGHTVQWWQNDEPLPQAVDRFRPDICHIMTIHNFVGLGPAEWLQKQGIPHVWSLMDYWMFCGSRMLLTGEGGDESCPAVTGVCDPSQCRSHRAPVRYMEVVTKSPIVALNEYTAAIYERNGIRVFDVGPLGVDHEYFKPDPSKREPRRVMTHSAWPNYPTKGMHILNAALKQTGIKGHLVTHAPRETVRDELQRASIHVFPSCYQETWGLCVVPGQVVYTQAGPKAIESVRIGDSVLTHKGQYGHVSHTFERPVSEEAIVQLHVGTLNEPLEMTGEHPVYVLRPPHRKFSTVRAALKRGLQPTWIEAAQVEAGDFLVVPKPSPLVTREDADLRPFTNVPEHDGELASKNGHAMGPDIVTYRDVAEACGLSYATVSTILGNYEPYIEPYPQDTRRKVRETARRMGWEPTLRSIPATMPLDYDFGLLLGYYVAEGSTGSNYAIELASHQDETAKRAKIQEILESWGLHVSTDFRKGCKTARLKTANKALCQVLVSLGGLGAAYKRFPVDLALQNAEFARGLVTGAWWGDGCYRTALHTKQSFTYCTISPDLAHDMRQVLLNLGILASLSRRETDNYVKYIVEVGGKQKARLAELMGLAYEPATERQGQGFIEAENCFYVPIAKVGRRTYTGSVYNLEVRGNNSYCLQGFAVHNCLHEARACGCACIASDVAGARAQIHHGYDGILVPPRNVDALAAALQMLYDDPAMCQELGQAARKSVEARGTLAHMARTYTRIYQHALDVFSGARKDVNIRAPCAVVSVKR